MMRKPTLIDALRFARVLKKLDLSTVDISDEVIDSKNRTKIGIEVLNRLIGRITEAEIEITEFLAGIFECTEDEVLEKPLDEMAKEVESMMSREDIQDFFKRARGWTDTPSKTLSSIDTADRPPSSSVDIGVTVSS